MKVNIPEQIEKMVAKDAEAYSHKYSTIHTRIPILHDILQYFHASTIDTVYLWVCEQNVDTNK